MALSWIIADMHITSQAGPRRYFTQISNGHYYIFKAYSRSWLVKTRRIIIGILKPSRNFSCWRHASMWPKFGPKKYYCTLWLPRPGAFHCLLKSARKFHIFARFISFFLAFEYIIKQFFLCWCCVLRWIWCLWCYSECISTPGELEKYVRPRWESNLPPLE